MFALLLSFLHVDRFVPNSLWVRASLDGDCVVDVATGECSVSSSDAVSDRDPNLFPLTYDVGYGEQTTYVFVEPSLEQMYQQQKNNVAGGLQKVTPDFNGFAGKFINMSNKKCTLFW